MVIITKKQEDIKMKKSNNKILTFLRRNAVYLVLSFFIVISFAKKRHMQSANNTKQVILKVVAVATKPKINCIAKPIP